MLTTKIKSAEHLEEHELNKILKHLSKNEEWLYYLIVRLGVSTALRFSDLSQIKSYNNNNNIFIELKYDYVTWL